MSVLKNFKNTPRSPYGGRQDLDVIFFLQICNEVHGRKKIKWGPVAPPTGDRGLSPTPGATGPPLYKPWPPFPCHLSLKFQEKREG